MKQLFFVALISISCSGFANAEITTKKQADQFITKYCISLVNKLEKTLKIKKGIKGDEEILELLVASTEPDQIIDTYIKLCK